MDEKDNEAEPYITAKQAARHLGLSRQTVYNKVSAGELPHYKSNGLLRFKRSELDQWMAGQPAEEGAA